MARRQGLKPAKRPAAKTVAADDMVRPLRAFSEVHAGEVNTVICELSLAEAGKKIMTSATVSRIAVMQYRTASILIFLDGCIIVTEDDFKDDFYEGVGPWIIYYSYSPRRTIQVSSAFAPRQMRTVQPQVRLFVISLFDGFGLLHCHLYYLTFRQFCQVIQK